MGHAKFSEKSPCSHHNNTAKQISLLDTDLTTNEDKLIYAAKKVLYKVTNFEVWVA